MKWLGQPGKEALSNSTDAPEEPERNGEKEIEQEAQQPTHDGKAIHSYSD